MASKAIPEQACTAVEVGNFSSAQNTPIEIRREILYYLPVKSLVRFRSISKSWKYIIEDPDFISSHLRCHTTYNNKPSLIIKEVDSEDWSVRSSTTFQKISKIKSFPLEDKWFVISALDGLLLFGSSSKLMKIGDGLLLFGSFSRLKNIEDVALMLWNPSIQKSVYIPPPPIRLLEYVNMDVVLGFDPSEDDYKVVTFVYDLSAFAIPPSFHVFSLKSRSWVEVSYSVVGESPNCVHHQYWNNVSIGEYIHWIGRVLANRNHSLVTLNLTTMTVFYSALPDQSVMNLNRFPVLIGKPFLGHSFIGLFTGGKAWVLKQLHPAVGLDPSWNKMHETELKSLHHLNFLYLTVDGYILSKESDKFYVPNLDLEIGEEKKFPDPGIRFPIFVNAYTESLVLLNWGNDFPVDQPRYTETTTLDFIEGIAD